MKFIYFHIWILFLLCFSLQVQASISDTLTPTENEQVTNQLEDLAGNTDQTLDFSDLTDEYIYYAQHPININGPDLKKLLQLHILNEFQLISIQNYIKQNGPILSIYELQLIPGLERQNLKQIITFIETTPPSRSKTFSLSRAIRTGKNQLLFRYTQQLEQSAAYKTSPDSAYLHPSSIYLGPPEKLYMRYGFNASERFRFGFTSEKDAGEVLPFSSIGDSINHLLGDKKPGFPDFFSAYATISDFGILKKATIGDYHLEFGQGLTLWSGLVFGKSSSACNVKYYGRGIRPNTSVNENRFFRGMAATFGVKDIDLTLFYSRQKTDGNFNQTDTLGNGEISSVQETGNHRTLNELLDKNTLRILSYGLHLSYVHRHYSVGATYYKTSFNPSLSSDNKPYKRFYFQGNRLTNFGFDFNYSLQKLILYGELSGNNGKSISGIMGTDVYLNDRLSVSLLYRNISKDYQVFYASPFIENSHISNEQGIYFGMEALLYKSMKLSAYVDYYSFPWLKYRINSPSQGTSLLVQLSDDFLRKFSMYVRFKYKEREENFSGEYDYYPTVIATQSYSYRYSLSYSVFDFLTLKSRLEAVYYLKDDVHEKGSLFYQDVLYRPSSLPLQLSFRYALFDTEGWLSRLYAYENDALYAFSIPAYYGKGQRIYLLIRWKPKENMSLWLRLARTTWFDRQEVGTGPDQIQGNHKTEVKLQWMMKF